MGSFEVFLDSEYQYSDITFDPVAFASEVRDLSPQLTAAAAPLHSWRYRVVKRCIDVMGSLVLLALFAIPGLLIAAAIALSSKGPIFYTETRIGRDGRRFRIWKFRSMRHEPDRQGSSNLAHRSGNLLQLRVQKKGSDPRVTRLGDFLRRWSLDELPQTLNVLRGDMSLVGPRPVIEAEIPLYGRLRRYYLAATPGLSGLWQVSGRSNVRFSARTELDAYYVRNWSLRLDLGILFQTIPAVLARTGAR